MSELYAQAVCCAGVCKAGNNKVKVKGHLLSRPVQERWDITHLPHFTASRVELHLNIVSFFLCPSHLLTLILNQHNSWSHQSGRIAVNFFTFIILTIYLSPKQMLSSLFKDTFRYVCSVTTCTQYANLHRTSASSQSLHKRHSNH